MKNNIDNKELMKIVNENTDDDMTKMLVLGSDKKGVYVHTYASNKDMARMIRSFLRSEPGLLKDLIFELFADELGGVRYDD